MPHGEKTDTWEREREREGGDSWNRSTERGSRRCADLSRMPREASAWLGSSGRPLTANSMMQPTKSWAETWPRRWRTGSIDRTPPTESRLGCTSRILHTHEGKHTNTKEHMNRNLWKAFKYTEVCTHTVTVGHWVSQQQQQSKAPYKCALLQTSVALTYLPNVSPSPSLSLCLSHKHTLILTPQGLARPRLRVKPTIIR